MELLYSIYSTKDSECGEQIWVSELRYKKIPPCPAAAFLNPEKAHVRKV